MLEILIGILVAIAMVFQFDAGEIGVNDVFRMMIVNEVGFETVETKVAREQVELKGEVEAVLVDYDADLAAVDFGGIDRVVAVFHNQSRLGRSNIVVPTGQSRDFVNANRPFLSEDYQEFLERLETEVHEDNISVFMVKEFVTTEEWAELEDYVDGLWGDVLVVGVVDWMRDDFYGELNREVLGAQDMLALDQSYIEGKHVVNWMNTEFGEDLIVSGLTDQERALTVLAFGDMMMGRFVRTLMDRDGDLNYVFENLPEDFLGGADIVFGNLEGPIKGEGRSGGTSMVFAFNEDIAPFLKESGFNLVSISNNHAVDAGWDGRDTTIAALDGAGVDWCGHPSEADPASVFYGEISDKSFAFICVHGVTFKLDVDATVTLIEEVRGQVDYLVVSPHWGPEYKHQPHYTLQVEPGRRFIDAGADIVIGHHPHVVQNFEVYNGKPIFYSLGNFVFDQYWSRETQEELGLGLVLGEEFQRIHLIPMKSERSQSRLMTEEERAEWIERFIGYGEYGEEMQEMIREGVIEISSP